MLVDPRLVAAHSSNGADSSSRSEDVTTGVRPGVRVRPDPQENARDGSSTTATMAGAFRLLHAIPTAVPETSGRPGGSSRPHVGAPHQSRPAADALPPSGRHSEGAHRPDAGVGRAQVDAAIVVPYRQTSNRDGGGDKTQMLAELIATGVSV